MTKHIINNTYLISPPHAGGETKQIHLDANRFDTNSPDYLIIGFDTEYQRAPLINDETGETLEHIRENEVLSYQYSCSILTANLDEENPEIEWSGIILPRGTELSVRLSLQEFVSLAISDGFEKFPKLAVPDQIFLIAHFTRADIPAFSDFKDEGNRKNLNLHNIRNSFVNVRKDMPVDLADTNTGEPISVKLKLRDTMHLAPNGAKSLGRLGEILNFPKITLANTIEAEKAIKQNMRGLLEDDWPLFREYAIRDAEVCAKYAKDIIRLYQSETGEFKLPLTLTSIGVKLLHQQWEEVGWDKLSVVGKEEITETKYNDATQRMNTTKRQVFQKKVYWNIDFVTETYHGGRNEQFWFGPGYEAKWNDYDLTSA